MQSRARRVLGILQAQQCDLEVPFASRSAGREQRFFVGIDCRPKRAAFAHPVVFGARLPHVTVTEIEIGPLRADRGSRRVRPGTGAPPPESGRAGTRRCRCCTRATGVCRTAGVSSRRAPPRRNAVRPHATHDRGRAAQRDRARRRARRAFQPDFREGNDDDHRCARCKADWRRVMMSRRDCAVHWYTRSSTPPLRAATGTGPHLSVNLARHGAASVWARWKMSGSPWRRRPT